jgi:hypothetical protein
MVTAPVSAEEVCFPLAEQAAQRLRQSESRKDERVALITSAEPSRLDASNWLRTKAALLGSCSFTTALVQLSKCNIKRSPAQRPG